MGGDKRSYYRLFIAYLLASLGTGVAVVALSLLAFELVRDEQQAAAVIGTALSIKMLAYIVGAPVEAAFLSGVPRRQLMVALDLIRAGAILLLPFVSQVWQLLGLIGVFTLASAAFTPAYQATVPALLPDPGDYARSLSRSRLAGEFEGLASPLVAAALLAVLPLSGVFLVAMAAFVGSAVLLAATRLPDSRMAEAPVARLVSGFAALLRDRALRGLAPIAFVGAAGATVVLVETVPLVRGRFGLGAEEAAMAYAAFGAGSVVGALALPRLLDAFAPRGIMLVGGALCAAALGAALAIGLFQTLLGLWFALGVATTLTQAPALALIARTVAQPDRQAVYAANVSLTTAVAALCFAASAAVAGIGSLPDATAMLAGVAAVGLVVALWLWRADGGPE